MTPAQPSAPPRTRRDPRLDFFRGLAMFIILIAHTRGNPWTLWIPARFGFSDATEIFVFCSGMASALAFGAVFATRGWLLGTARIAFRVWQVYWAHVGVFLVSAAFLAAIDAYGWGLPGERYVTRPYVVPIFEDSAETLIGLLTLRYVPGLFDILPMYLAILAMIPLVMALHRAGGGAGAAAFVATLWAGATLAGYAHSVDLATWRYGDGPLLRDALVRVGAQLQWMNFTGRPGTDAIWFFNPFGWQLVFFTGFAFGMKWLPAPPVSRRLTAVAAAFVALSVPFAWYAIHGVGRTPDASLVHVAITETRDALRPLWWKTWQGALRYLHFLALAYLAWVAVGAGGRVISEGFEPSGRRAGSRKRLALVGGSLALATAPYAWIPEIRHLAPTLDAWFAATLPLVSGGTVAVLQLVHYAGLALLIWSLLPEATRRKALGPWWRAATPVIRKVGTQSLAVFMTSIPLALLNALILDLTGRNVLTVAIVNLFGFAVLIGTAYLCSWIKGHPWRRPAPAEKEAARPAPAE